jgi:hypothetical protein
MNNKTGRFLLLEGIVILGLLLLGQFFMYPIAGKSALPAQMDKSLSMFKHHQVLEADVDSSVIYIIEIDGYLCEKMFDKSLVFDRYVEKPLVMLRRADDSGDYLFIARDSASDMQYLINDNQELVLLKKEQNGSLNIAYAIFGATVILMGISFGAKRRQSKTR